MPPAQPDPGVGRELAGAGRCTRISGSEQKNCHFPKMTALGFVAAWSAWAPEQWSRRSNAGRHRWAGRTGSCSGTWVLLEARGFPRLQERLIIQDRDLGRRKYLSNAGAVCRLDTRGSPGPGLTARSVNIINRRSLPTKRQSTFQHWETNCEWEKEGGCSSLTQV